MKERLVLALRSQTSTVGVHWESWPGAAFTGISSGDPISRFARVALSSLKSKPSQRSYSRSGSRISTPRSDQHPGSMEHVVVRQITYK